ncbi:hypothetical protein JCM3770_004896 [Rhodotorula araucariae]
MKTGTLLALALSASTAAVAHAASHHADRRAFAAPGLHRLAKKQLPGAPGVGAVTGATSSPAVPATSAAQGERDATSAPASVPPAPAETTAAPGTSAPAVESSSSAAATSSLSPPAESVPPSSASSSSSSLVPSSTARASSPPASSSSATSKAIASTATERVVSSASDAASSGSSTAASSSSPASASAAADKKDGGDSSGGISKAVLIPIIAVASSLALIGAVWTIVRKTKFSPSRRFEAKLAPIDYAPDAVHRSGDDDRDAILAHARNGSQLSVVGHGGAGAHYAPSLARSDSGKMSDRGGMVMSESLHNVGSIPYNGPAYVQAPYYGAPAYSQAQPGYPHEQAYAYGELHRAGSFSNTPYADPRPSSPALGRMPTSRSGLVSPAPITYDYGAQARAVSRNQVRY